MSDIRYRVANDVMKLNIGDTAKLGYFSVDMFTVIDKTDDTIVVADSRGDRRTYTPDGPRFAVFLLDGYDTTPGVHVDGPEGRCTHCDELVWQDSDGAWLSITDFCHINDSHEVSPTNVQQAEVIANADPDD